MKHTPGGNPVARADACKSAAYGKMFEEYYNCIFNLLELYVWYEK